MYLQVVNRSGNPAIPAMAWSDIPVVMLLKVRHNEVLVEGWIRKVRPLAISVARL